MAKKTSSKKTLVDYERANQQLASRLSKTGFLWSGSLTKRYLKCGRSGCACHKDPQARSYFQITLGVKRTTLEALHGKSQLIVDLDPAKSDYSSSEMRLAGREGISFDISRAQEALASLRVNCDRVSSGSK